MKVGAWIRTPNGWARPLVDEQGVPVTHTHADGTVVQLCIGHIAGNRVVGFERGPDGAFRKVYRRTHFPYASPGTPGFAFMRDWTVERDGRVIPYPDSMYAAAHRVNADLRVAGIECDDAVPPECRVSTDPTDHLWGDA